MNKQRPVNIKNNNFLINNYNIYLLELNIKIKIYLTQSQQQFIFKLIISSIKKPPQVPKNTANRKFKNNTKFDSSVRNLSINLFQADSL